MLCSALVNPHFEYACNAWHMSVNAKVKHKLPTTQNKITIYLLNYGCRRNIGFSDFKVLLADRKVEAPCNAHGVFIIKCEV